MEGGGDSATEFTDIETAAHFLDKAVTFHVITDILDFVLFMHQQIPCTLHDITLEYDCLQTEYKDLESALSNPEVMASLRRKHVGRKREVKQGIRRFSRLMDAVSSVKNSLQLLINQIPDVESVLLILGASTLRPLHVYELCFLHGRMVFRGDCDFTKTKAAAGLSRKAIRTLISNGAGTDSYAGPTKLFLLVKAPSSFDLPQHFVPKRDFKYSNKMVPFRLRFKCRTQHQGTNAPNYDIQTASSVTLMDSTSDDRIWFQCRNSIKGLATKTSLDEE